jgi:hypothetical protein
MQSPAAPARWAIPVALVALTVLVAVAATKAREHWRATEELRRPLASLAAPGPEQVALDCAALPGPRRWVILVLGQSNAANHVQTRADAGPGVFVFHAGRCYAARDPLPGASGDGGSVWTRLAPMLIASGQVDSVLLVPLAVNASTVAQWLHHPALVRAQNETFGALRQNRLEASHVLWHQGEADSYKRTTAEDYRRDLLALFQRLREQGVRAPIWVARATLCQQRRNPEVRAVQEALPAEQPGLRAGPDLDALFGPEHRYDGCHFGTGSALLAAEAWRDALLGPGPRP